MSAKYTSTTADYLQWSEMIRLIRNLYDDGDFSDSLLLACGSFFGLRVSDILKLRWADIINTDTLTLNEQKTGKRRIVTINPKIQKHIKTCYKAINPESDNKLCFASNSTNNAITTQWLNRKFKIMRVKYRLPIQNFSTHSMRKTFGRQVVEMSGNESEMALIKLSEIFGHSSSAITRRYLGLKQEEIRNTYNLLTF